MYDTGPPTEVVGVGTQKYVITTSGTQLNYSMFPPHLNITVFKLV